MLTVKDKIINIAEQTIGVTLKEDEPLKESGVDSLTLVSLILLVEESFGITFADDDLQPENINALSDIVKITEKYL